MLLKTQLKPARAPSPLERLIDTASGVILGKESQVRLALACLIARGHLLIEDLPGVGKTTLAHVLAKAGLARAVGMTEAALTQYLGGLK